MHPLGLQVRCFDLGLSPTARHSLAWLTRVDGTCKGGEAQKTNINPITFAGSFQIIHHSSDVDVA